MNSIPNPARTVPSLTALALLMTAAALYAGPLDPPAGPVTRTNKTLSEIEPRIAINAANTPGDATCKFRISQPGSYYLANNILGETGTHIIKIALGPAGGQVSLDMNGFTLRGLPGSLDCIHIDPGNDPLTTSYDVHNDGEIYAAASSNGYAINSNAGAGRIADVRVTSGGLGCVRLAGGANRTTTIEHCTIRSTKGAALVTDSSTACALRNNVIEGEGCNTSSLLELGGPTAPGWLEVIACSHSVFSGPIIDITPTGSMTADGGGGSFQMRANSVSAASAMRVSAGTGASFVEDRTFDDEFMACTFTTAIIDIARDGSVLRGTTLRTDAATSAPIGVRLAANNLHYGGPQDGSGTDNANFAPSVPIAFEVVGSNNTISGCRITSGTVGIRLTGSGNTVSSCTFNRAGNDPIANIVITAGSTNNLVIKNEFRNNAGGTAVSNLGGPTNGIAPIVTPGNLAAATNPFSNIQH